jgi:hypothetical protein
MKHFNKRRNLSQGGDRMKKLCLFLALLLIPASAMAGMQAVSDVDLEGVTGQTGITISMTVTIQATSMAWGDSDGFGTYTTAGWVVLRNVTMPNTKLTNVTIDCGSDGTNSILQIDVGTGNLIEGTLIIGNVVIGTTSSATTESIGEIRATGLGIKTGAIRISGH